MKKLIIFTFLLISTFTQSQTYIKANTISTLVLMPNLGVETSIGKKSTFQFDVLASFWEKINNAPFKFVSFTPEYRYHFREKYNGFYAGAHVGVVFFNLQKPTKDYLGTDFREEGLGYFMGATIGYQKKLNDRFVIDFYVGGGNLQSFYKGYYISTGERYDATVTNYNKSGEWLPYRGGIMICYRLN